MSNPTRTIASLLAGLAIGLSAANHFFSFFRRSVEVQTGLWIGLSLAAAVGVHSLWRWRRRRQPAASRPALLAWLGLCLLLSAALVFALPDITPIPPQALTLSISATGEKNPAADGQEVHLERVRLDGDWLPLEALEQQGIWEMTPGGLSAYGPYPAYLTYRARYLNPDQIQFVFDAGPNRGKATATLNGEEKSIDLYAPEPDTRRSLSFRPRLTPDIGWSLPLRLADALTLASLIFLFLPPVHSLERKLPGKFREVSAALFCALDRTSPLFSSLGRGVKGALPVLGINLALIVLILVGFELVLRRADPRRNLPLDGKIDGQHWTWGHRVQNNSWGFREKEIASPKPAGTCRIMVLGDSLTWGQGLAVEDRYTHQAEALLAARFPDRAIEVLNFGIQGLPTTQERDILYQYQDQVEPDQVVVGFCYNDLQPKEQDYRAERVLYDQRHPFLVHTLPDLLSQAGLSALATRYRTGLDTALIQAGIVPDWPVGLDRTYAAGSREWSQFEAALKDIRQLSNNLQLPPPLFLVLNQGSYPDRPVNFENPDEYQRYILEWSRQAEQAAASAGFRAFNTEAEIASAFAGEPMAVNLMDGHPNAKANQVYAQKLFDLLAPEIEAGRLCAPFP